MLKKIIRFVVAQSVNRLAGYGQLNVLFYSIDYYSKFNNTIYDKINLHWGLLSTL